MMPDEKSHGLGTPRESCQNKCPISDDFGLRRPVSQKNNSQKKVYLYHIICPANNNVFVCSSHAAVEVVRFVSGALRFREGLESSHAWGVQRTAERF